MMQLSTVEEVLEDLRNGLHRDLLGRKGARGFDDLVTVDPRRAPFAG